MRRATGYRAKIEVVSDGDFSMGGNALWTAAHMGIPAKEYAYDRLIDDDGLTMIMMPATSNLDQAIETIEHEGLREAVEGVVETHDTTGVLRGTVERFPPRLYLRETGLTLPDDAIRAMAELARGIDGLVKHIRAEQQDLRGHIIEQGETNKKLRELMEAMLRESETDRRPN